MYDFNEEYFQVEVEHMRNGENSELLDTLLSYDKPLPSVFSSLFNSHVNSYDVPRNIVNKFLEKHEDNLINHIRLESFKFKEESFGECDDRLMSQFVKETGSPLFGYTAVNPKDYMDSVYIYYCG